MMSEENMIIAEDIDGRVGWFCRLLGRLGRRYWIARIDLVLARAHECGAINNDELHALDNRLKYDPTRPWHGWLS